MAITILIDFPMSFLSERNKNTVNMNKMFVLLIIGGMLGARAEMDYASAHFGNVTEPVEGSLNVRKGSKKRGLTGKKRRQTNYVIVYFYLVF